MFDWNTDQTHFHVNAVMIQATRQWFRRNRGRLAVGAGAVGAVYLAGQYAWSKWLEARVRMGEDRIAKEKSVVTRVHPWAVLTSVQPTQTIRAEPGGLHLYSTCIAANSTR